MDGVPSSSAGSQPRSSVTELEQYFHTACCTSKREHCTCRADGQERTSSEKSTMPTLDRTKSGATNRDAKEREHALKDKAGGSVVLGIADNGVCTDGERMGERKRRARQTLASGQVAFRCWILYQGKVWLTGAYADPPVCRSRSRGFPEIALNLKM